mmetsp:Transcript_20556/g.69699  ORF Transcript_20556/g.69699 Transcript_20556/m.69699 type:complete len:123 (-) Transcript_20556:134-502(-)
MYDEGDFLELVMDGFGHGVLGSALSDVRWDHFVLPLLAVVAYALLTSWFTLWFARWAAEAHKQRRKDAKRRAPSRKTCAVERALANLRARGAEPPKYTATKFHRIVVKLLGGAAADRNRTAA